MTDHDLVKYIEREFDDVDWKLSTEEHLIDVLGKIARALVKAGYRGGKVAD